MEAFNINYLETLDGEFTNLTSEEQLRVCLFQIYKESLQHDFSTYEIHKSLEYAYYAIKGTFTWSPEEKVYKNDEFTKTNE